MPTYRIKIDGSTYKVNSPQELTDAQAYELVAGQHEQYKEKHDTAVKADQDAVKARFQEEEKSRPLGERIRSNLGAGFHSLVQGVGGLVGAVDDDEVKEHKALKQQLAQNMPGGEYVQMVGEALPTLAVPAGAGGQLLARGVGALSRRGGQRLTQALASRAGNVANIAGTGAALGAATTAGDLEDRLLSGGVGAVAGAAVPGVAAAGQAVRRMATTRGGQRAAGERFLRELEQEAPGRADEMVEALRDPVARARHEMGGVTNPTAAQLTGDPVLRELEVGARTKQGATFGPGDELAAQGRADVLGDIAQNPRELALAEGARTAATAPMRDAALRAAGQSQGFEQPVLRAAQQIASGDARSNPAVQTMTRYVLGELEQGVTPQQLYSIRKTLTSGVPKGTELGAAITQARAERMALVESIDDALDAATGKTWRPYLQKYQELSAPVTQMKAGQAVQRDFQNAASTTARGDPVLTAGKLRTALRARAEKQFGGKMLPRMSAEARSRLEAVADTAEAAAAAKQSQGLTGSRTAGNIAAGENVSGIASGVGALVGGLPGATIASVLPKWHGDRAERILARILQDPEQLAALIRKAQASRAAQQTVGRYGGQGGRAVGEALEE